MLNTISWSEYLTCIALLIAGYYTITGIFYYRADISSRFRKKEERTDNGVGQAPSLMGAIKTGPPKAIRKQLVAADELFISPDQEQLTASDSMIIGTIADLLEESKVLAKTIAHDNNTPEEGASLFQSLLQRYPQLNNAAYKDAISISLHHTCKNDAGIEFSLEQINDWWPTDLTPSSN